MSITLRVRRWSVALGLAAVLATTYGGGAPSSAQRGDTAGAIPAPGGATTAATCPSGEYPAIGALRLGDGTVEWLTCSPEETFRSVVGASDTVVLIEESGPAGRLTIAFDAVDGSERWRRSTPDIPTPVGPIAGQGIVVLADQAESALVGLDAASGEEKWRVASREAPIAHSATVAVVGGVVGFGGSFGFRGIDRLTGDELWVSPVSLADQSGVMVGRSPAAVLGEIIAVPTGPSITALDMRTGAVLWQAPQLAHLAAADEVFVGIGGAGGPTHLATVMALDAASGQQRWTASGRPSYGGLVAVGDGVAVVLASTRPEIVAYELSSGNERWRAELTLHVEPQQISGTSVILLWEGKIAVISTGDGTTIWSATEPFRSPLMNSVGSNGETIFVAINSRPWGD